VKRRPKFDRLDEEFGLQCLTVLEIAHELGLPALHVRRQAAEMAARLGRPVDDLLREWFSMLVLH
jgi:hypothetical protein